ncbi:MAG: lipopolysaccharide kinase InaA family protein [Planctomycetota bacterium]
MRRFRSKSLRFAEWVPAELREGLGYPDAEAAFADRRGTVLRRTPRRITFRTRLADGITIFRKLRVGRLRDAVIEWRSLHALTDLGLTVPRPILMAVSEQGSSVVFAEVPGRNVKEQLAEAGRRPAGFEEFVRRRVAPTVRTLHEAGLVHRDLYWNHVFAEDLAPEGPPVALIDVERIRRIGWPRRRRWLVKDLAGLCSSWPLPDDLGLARRLLGDFDAQHENDRGFTRDVLLKARRIRSHVPKWDGEPGDPAAPWP